MTASGLFPTSGDVRYRAAISITVIVLDCSVTMISRSLYPSHGCPLGKNEHDPDLLVSLIAQDPAYATKVASAG